MKKSTLFKSIAAALFIVVGMGANAQVTGAGTMVATTVSPDLQSVDYVTVGSTMPYEVSAYDWKSLNTVFESAFKWEVTSGDGSTIKTTAGAALTQIGSTGYFTDKSVGINWSTKGTKTLSVTEIGKKISSTDLTSCAGTPVTLTVEVLDRPKASWGSTYTDPSACEATGYKATIPVTCAGSNDITVAYHVKFTPLTGSATDNDYTTTVTASGYGKNGVAGSFDISAAVAGTYEVTLIGVYDKVSEKSFALSTAGSAARVGTAGTDFDNTKKTFYINPTPSTSPIQHIQNL